MTTVFLASPMSKFQGNFLTDMPVLVSFALWSGWESRFQQAWGPMLLDSGAFSAFNSGTTMDLDAYAEFVREWGWRFEAVAGLDDIGGDWRKSLRNYETIGFPTLHNTDPPELLQDLIPIARERGGWIGLGIKPINGRREYARDWVARSLSRMPDDLHVHGWAMRAFLDLGRLDSVDSTNWFRDAHAVLARGMPLPWLTEGEAIEIIIKRYKRERLCARKTTHQLSLFEEIPTEGIREEDGIIRPSSEDART
jgi:hypothetical protein